MEESIAGGRGEGASVSAIGPSPKSANTAVVPPAARALRDASHDAEPGAADGAAEDGAGQTTEPVVDGSDSTQIRSFFENLLNSTGDS
jgi:hypothetical protein